MSTKLALLVIAIVTLSACSENNTKSGNLNADPFYSDARIKAGKEAIDCGYLKAKQDRTDIDACVAEYFFLVEPFYAVYEIEKHGVMKKYGIAYDQFGDLYILTVGDGSASAVKQGGLVSSLCKNASVAPLDTEGVRVLPIECE